MASYFGMPFQATISFDEASKRKLFGRAVLVFVYARTVVAVCHGMVRRRGIHQRPVTPNMTESQPFLVNQTITTRVTRKKI